MHIADLDAGDPGANGIVGGGNGELLVRFHSANAEDQARLLFAFGDGATNEGVFHEAVNMASIWNLPVIFTH